VALVDEHWMELEADFQREYNLDLAQCLWGKKKLSARKIFVLVAQLGPETATAKYFTKGWNEEKELLATLIELMGVSRAEFLAANGVKQSQLPPPIQITRPYISQRIKRKAEPSDIKQIFGEGIIIREPKEEVN